MLEGAETLESGSQQSQVAQLHAEGGGRRRHGRMRGTKYVFPVTQSSFCWRPNPTVPERWRWHRGHSQEATATDPELPPQ